MTVSSYSGRSTTNIQPSVFLLDIALLQVLKIIAVYHLLHQTII